MWWAKIRDLYERASFAVGIACFVVLGPIFVFTIIYALIWTPYCLVVGCGPSRLMMELYQSAY